MNVIGGGLIIILNYASSEGLSDNNALLTESGNDLLTEASDYIDVEF